jgi:hypothetical protein
VGVMMRGRGRAELAIDTPPTFPAEVNEHLAGIRIIGFDSLDESAAVDEGPPVDETLSVAEPAALAGNGESEEIIVDGTSVGILRWRLCVRLPRGPHRWGGVMRPNRVMLSRLSTRMGEARIEAASSPEVTQAVMQWSACLGAKGYSYANPSQLWAIGPQGRACVIDRWLSTTWPARSRSAFSRPPS